MHVKLPRESTYVQRTHTYSCNMPWICVFFWQWIQHLSCLSCVSLHLGTSRGCSLRHRSHEECDQVFSEHLQWLDGNGWHMTWVSLEVQSEHHLWMRGEDLFPTQIWGRYLWNTVGIVYLYIYIYMDNQILKTYLSIDRSIDLSVCLSVYLSSKKSRRA